MFFNTITIGIKHACLHCKFFYCSQFKSHLLGENQCCPDIHVDLDISMHNGWIHIKCISRCCLLQLTRKHRHVNILMYMCILFNRHLVICISIGISLWDLGYVLSMHNHRIVVRGMDMNMHMQIQIRVRVQILGLRLLCFPKRFFMATMVLQCFQVMNELSIASHFLEELFSIFKCLLTLLSNMFCVKGA